MNVKKSYEGRKVLALEIAGICYQNIDQCKNFPFINKYINKADFEQHTFTDWKKVFFRKKIFRHKLLKGENGEKLKHEYITGIVTYPHLFLKVKFKSFTEILGINRTYLWFFDFTMKNNLGLEQSDKYRYLRLKPRKHWFKIRNHKYLRFISGAHIVWLSVNILFLIIVLFKYFTKRQMIYLFYVANLCIPFFYYCSYLLAASGATFRYMYPSTLLVQIIFINLLIYFLVKTTNSIYIRFTSQHYS